MILDYLRPNTLQLEHEIPLLFWCVFITLIFIVRKERCKVGLVAGYEYYWKSPSHIFIS
jgi:hypothetical protein